MAKEKTPKARQCPNCEADIPDTDEKCPNKECGFDLKKYDELVASEQTPFLRAFVKSLLKENSPKPPEKKSGWF